MHTEIYSIDRLTCKIVTHTIGQNYHGNHHERQKYFIFYSIMAIIYTRIL